MLVMTIELKGKKVVVTGALSSLTRDQATRQLEALGAIVTAQVTKNTDILFCGERAGMKLEKAEKLGIAIYQEKDLALLLGDEAFLASPKGKVISGDHPVIAELSSHAKELSKRTVVAGELYAVGSKDRIRCGDIAHAMGGGSKAQVERMRFAAFDYLAEIESEEETAEDTFAYSPRLEALKGLFEKGELVTCVATEVISGAPALRELYEQWVKSGDEEGLVVRSAKQRPIKIKPDIHIDAVVIGYTIRREDPQQ